MRPWYDHFPGAQDVEFLPAIGAQGWILLTKDRAIRRRQLEIDAILNSGVRAFVLTATDLPRGDQAQVFVRAMRKIHKICRQRGPFIFNITRMGQFNQISNRTLRRRARGKPARV